MCLFLSKHCARAFITFGSGFHMPMLHCIAFLVLLELVVLSLTLVFTLVTQSSSNSSALFLTAAAQNLLCLKLAEEFGLVIVNPWFSWFSAASFPAFVSLLATPLILYKVYPPEIKDTPDAPAMAAEKLDLMGPVTIKESVMICTMLVAVSLWVFGYVAFQN